MDEEVICPEHGRQGIGFVCIHVARAVDSGQQVGFFWEPHDRKGRPAAWCLDCEKALLAVPDDASTDAWRRSCDFKLFCAGCWDRAQAVLYHEPRTKGN